MNAGTPTHPINWKRGLHRVFAVLWVIWGLFLFGWLPLQQIHRAQRFAQEMYARDLDAIPSNERERAEWKARQDERRARASWSHVYKSEVIPNIWLFLAAAVFVPIIAYALVRGVLVIVGWLFRGFTTP